MKKRAMNVGLTLAEVMVMDRIALTAHWETLFGSPPPKHSYLELLRQTVGWQVQAQVSGGLDYTCRQILQRGAVAPMLGDGTRLIREWQGISHQVTVLDKGFEYEGKVYRSLSAIAREITGTSWNGLVFFGVKK